MTQSTQPTWTEAQINAVQEYLDRHRVLLSRDCQDMCQKIDDRQPYDAYSYMQNQGALGEAADIYFSVRMRFGAAIDAINRMLQEPAKKPATPS